MTASSFEVTTDWRRSRATCLLGATVGVVSIVGGLLSGRNAVTGSVATGIFPRSAFASGGWPVAALWPLHAVGSSLCCATMGELVAVVAAVTVLGIDLERVRGSSGVAGTVLWMLAFYVLLHVAASALFAPADWPLWAIPCTAAWLPMALAALRRLTCPPARRFTLLRSVVVSDSVFGDALAVLAAMSTQGAGTAITGLCVGFLVASRAASAVLAFRLPSKALRHWLDAPAVTARFYTPATTPARAAAAARAPAAAPPTTTTTRPDMTGVDDAVRTIRDFGYSEEAARTALRQTNGDVTRAVNLLLDGALPGVH